MGWTKKLRAAFAVSFLLLVAVSCTISYKFNAPLGTVFNDELQTIYMTQTRLSLVPRGGDLVVSGEITGYDQLNQSVKADGFSSETQLKVTVNVRFTNNTNHAEDFEQQFSAFRNYDSSMPLNTVQDGLIDEIVDEIVDQIFNATVANW